MIDPLSFMVGALVMLIIVALVVLMVIIEINCPTNGGGKL